jgi:hypothetical protein
MAMRRECNRELRLTRSPFAYVDEVRMQRGFAASQSNTETPRRIKFLQPVKHLVSM